MQVTAPNPNSGPGAGSFRRRPRTSARATRSSGISRSRRPSDSDLNFEVGYLGSKNTHLGLPEANLNQLPAADLSLGSALTAQSAESVLRTDSRRRRRWDSRRSRSSNCCGRYPRFTNVALFRDNVADSEYEALQTKLEKRFSRGLTFTFAYTFSKLIDDASSYFSQTIFTGPTLTTIGAADAFNRQLERDVSSGDIPRVFSAGWVYRIPRWWKISGWQIGGLVRVQAGDAVPVTQATNTLSAFGYAVQRPNRISNPNDFATRSAPNGLTRRPSALPDSSPSVTVRGIRCAGPGFRMPT